MGQDFFPIHDQCIRYWVYTELAPPLVVGVAVRQQVAIQSVAAPFPLNRCQVHLPSPYESLVDAVLRPIRFPVESEAVLPC